MADSFFGLETGIDEAILSDEEAGRAYLCGAFLANGSIRDPESGKYQLEISSVYLDHAQGIASLLQQFLLDAKVLERKKGAVTYLQRAEDIMDFLIVSEPCRHVMILSGLRFYEKPVTTSIGPIMPRQLISLGQSRQHEDYQQYQ